MLGTCLLGPQGNDSRGNAEAGGCSYWSPGLIFYNHLFTQQTSTDPPCAVGNRLGSENGGGRHPPLKESQHNSRSMLLPISLLLLICPPPQEM